MMIPKPIRLTRMVRKIMARGRLIHFRGASPLGLPYTLARGGPMPRSARVARSLRSLASRLHALDYDRNDRDVIHPLLRRRPDGRNPIDDVHALEHATEYGIAEVSGRKSAVIETRIVDQVDVE